jgi:hypothetical protein
MLFSRLHLGPYGGQGCRVHCYNIFRVYQTSGLVVPEPFWSPRPEGTAVTSPCFGPSVPLWQPIIASMAMISPGAYMCAPADHGHRGHYYKALMTQLCPPGHQGQQGHCCNGAHHWLILLQQSACPQLLHPHSGHSCSIHIAATAAPST